MSAERIDVLAVMDDATRMCGGVTDETGARVAEARAAVAELIEKGRNLDAGWEVGTSGGYIAILADDLSAFRAALARVGGAS